MVRPLMWSEKQCQVDYDYTCMIPDQNMPPCKSFLCIERAHNYLVIYLELGLNKSRSAQTLINPRPNINVKVDV